MNAKALAYVCATAVMIAGGGAGSSQVTSRNRILRPVDAAQLAPVRGTAHPMARAQFDRGRTDTTKILSASLTFRLSSAQQADMDLFLRQLQDRTSRNFHRWLTPEQYAARFGMTSADLAKVTGWLQSQGLTVDGISRNRNEINFSGSVGQIEYALKTELHNYVTNGEQHFANATDLAFPAAFSSQVLGVRGLDDFRPKSRLHRASPKFTSSVSGNHFVIPRDFATIYDLDSLYTRGLDGAGQTIAVVGQTAISMSDIDAFRTAAGLPKYDPTLLLVPSTGASQHSTGDETEADLDIEWSGAVAKNAGIIYVYVGNSTTKTVFDALKYAITNNVAPIISISYGNCEAALGSSVVMTMQQWAQQANSQGQTISGPSGDDGAADCESSTATVATHGLAVDVPAAIPEVTGVGGSEFSGDAAATVSGGCASATTFWTGSCSATSGASAISYIPEMGWNDTNSNGLAASGGGASTIFSKPPWQTGTGVPSDGKRDVPDVAFDGANGHDPYLICSQDFFTGGSNATSCSNGFRASDQSLAAIGGTSAGAPTFAGVLAILNQATRSNGLGNVNPDLYNLSGTSAFHDITSGNNKVPCTTGTPNCPSGTLSIGFNAGTGYDQATGLGSMDVANLEAAWPGLVINQDYVVAASPSLITVSSPGQNVSSTVLAGSLNGFSGTVALSCLVSSTTSGVGCSLSSPSISIDSSTTNQRVAVSLTTTAASVNARRLGATFWACTLLLLPGILLCSAQADSFKRTLRVLAVGLLALAVGCGGGSSSSQKQQSQGTPAGTYTVTVTGTSGALSHSATVSLTVQ